jgi:hypothetical protein
VQIDIGAKFAATFLSHCVTDVGLPAETELAPGVWASQKFGVEIADHWGEWLGSLATDAMKTGGLALYVARPSSQPEVLDAENQDLQQTVNDVLNGLLIQGVPTFEKGFIVNGANIGGKIDIRQYGTTHDTQVTWGLPDFVVGVEQLARAVRLATIIRFFREGTKQPEWARLIRGVERSYKRTVMVMSRGTGSISSSGCWKLLRSRRSAQAKLNLDIVGRRSLSRMGRHEISS